MYFKINNIIWKIVFRNPSDEIFVRTNGTRTVGVTDLRTKNVYLSSNLYGAFLKKVLCHEIVHCAIFSYKVNLSIEQEELIADLISTYGEEIFAITDEIFRNLKTKVG